MKFCELTESEFSKFEEKNPFGNVMQTVERAKLREKMGFRSFLLGIKDENKVLAAGLAVEKNQEVWMQIGPVLDWSDIKIVRCFIDGLVDFCRAHKFNEIEIFPPVLVSERDAHGEKLVEYDTRKIFGAFEKKGFKHLGFTTKTEFKALRWMFVKNLTGLSTMEEIEATFKSNTRNKMRKTRRELDMYVLKDKKELKEWIKPLYDSNARNGIVTRDLSYFEDVWDTFGENAIFVEARQKEDQAVVASELCLVHPNELLSFLAGIKEEYKNKNGATAIKDWQFQECLKRGIKRLNFYGVEADFSENNRLLEFKSGFKGVVEEYIGGFKLVLNPIGYYWQKILKRLKH